MCVLQGPPSKWLTRPILCKETDQVPHWICCQGIFHHHAIQNSTFDSDLHLCTVSPTFLFLSLFAIIKKGMFFIVIFALFSLKTGSDKGSETAKCGLKCGICCFYCLEKFIRYLNHNAYTIIAIEGVHFCKAAGIVSIKTVINYNILVQLGHFFHFSLQCTEKNFCKTMKSTYAGTFWVVFTINNIIKNPLLLGFQHPSQQRPQHGHRELCGRLHPFPGQMHCDSGDRQRWADRPQEESGAALLRRPPSAHLRLLLLHRPLHTFSIRGEPIATRIMVLETRNNKHENLLRRNIMCFTPYIQRYTYIWGV